MNITAHLYEIRIKAEMQITMSDERNKMRATEVVLFDLDDTLHDDTAAYRVTALRVAVYVADRFGIDAQAMADAYLAEVQQFYEVLAPEHVVARHQHVQARWWGRAFVEFGIRDREFAAWCSFAFEQLQGRHLMVLPGVHEMLAGLREKGVQLGLLTNGFAGTHRKKIVDLGLERSFDEFFLADEIGMVKPDPEIFRYACKRFRTRVERAVMVGDRYERDIVGAREAGLFTVWVNRGRSALPDAAPEPDATVHAILDTPGVLPPILRP